MTTDDPLAELLARPLPPGITALPRADRDALAALIAEARAARVQELTTAAFGALDNVPRVLRGTVRKVVGL